MAEKYIECDYCDCNESEWYDEDSEGHYYKCYQCGGTTTVWKEEVEFSSVIEVELSNFYLDEKDEKFDYIKYYVKALVEVEDSEDDVYKIEYHMSIGITKGEIEIESICRAEKDDKEYSEDFDNDLLEDKDFQKYTIESFKNEKL